jgi:hypothetical protein
MIFFEKQASREAGVTHDAGKDYSIGAWVDQQSLDSTVKKLCARGISCVQLSKTAEFDRQLKCYRNLPVSPLLNDAGEN